MLDLFALHRKTTAVRIRGHKLDLPCGSRHPRRSKLRCKALGRAKIVDVQTSGFADYVSMSMSPGFQGEEVSRVGEGGVTHSVD